MAELGEEGVMIRRFWSGVIWLPTPTVDGRRIQRDALVLLDDLRVRTRDGAAVGSVIDFEECRGIGLAWGWVRSEPGTFGAAIELTAVETEVQDDGSLLVLEAHIVALTLCDDPAWPNARITVYDVEIPDGYGSGWDELPSVRRAVVAPPSQSYKPGQLLSENREMKHALTVYAEVEAGLRSLHVPDTGGACCLGCDRAWPCETVRIIFGDTGGS